MTFAVSGGIEWEKDDTNKVLTIRPTTAFPENPYNVGEIKNFPSEGSAPWGKITTTGYTLVLESGVTSIGNYAFSNCTGFTGTLNLPSTVVSIKPRAFFRCTGFTGDLTIPNGVTNIETYAFDSCYGFNGTLTLPSNIISIDAYAFEGCSRLTGTITFPSSVAIIGNSAFTGCQNIDGIKFLGNKPMIGSDTFTLNGWGPTPVTYDATGAWVSATTIPQTTYTKWEYHTGDDSVDKQVWIYTTDGWKALDFLTSSNKINKMTDYAIATSSGAISQTDTLNQAMGKVEYGLNNPGSIAKLTGYVIASVPSALSASMTQNEAFASLERRIKTLEDANLVRYG